MPQGRGMWCTSHMERLGTRLLIKCAAIYGLCTIAWTPVALAGPPPGHGSMVARVGGEAHAGRASGSLKVGTGQLDLRPPANVPQAAADAAATSGFPSSRRLGGSTADALQLPGLGTTEAHPREMSRVEEFARRVHREGLPIARLWESHSALVSLGLNQRGKPGIWLIQKTH
jgi:hypothetical protein